MYSKFITLKKMVYQGAIVGASAFLTYCTTFIGEMPPGETGVTFGVILVLIKGLENYLKHRSE